MRHSGTDPSLNKTLLAFMLTHWCGLRKVTMIARKDANFADDEGRLILIARGGGY